MRWSSNAGGNKTGGEFTSGVMGVALLEWRYGSGVMGVALWEWRYGSGDLGVAICRRTENRLYECKGHITQDFCFLAKFSAQNFLENSAKTISHRENKIFLARFSKQIWKRSCTNFAFVLLHAKF